MLTMFSKLRTMIADFIPATLMNGMLTLHNYLLTFLEWSLTEIT